MILKLISLKHHTKTPTRLLQRKAQLDRCWAVVGGLSLPFGLQLMFECRLLASCYS